MGSVDVWNMPVHFWNCHWDLLQNPPFVHQVLIFQFLSFVLLSLFVSDQLWGCCWCVWGLSGTWGDRSRLTPGSHVTHQCFWRIWSGHSAKAIHTYACGYSEFCIPVCSTGAFARWLSCTPPRSLHQEEGSLMQPRAERSLEQLGEKPLPSAPLSWLLQAFYYTGMSVWCKHVCTHYFIYSAWRWGQHSLPHFTEAQRGSSSSGSPSW